MPRRPYKGQVVYRAFTTASQGNILEKTHQTTSEHFKRFRSECERLVSSIRLDDWEVNYSWSDLEIDHGEEGILALTAWDLEQRSVTFKLNKEFYHEKPAVWLLKAVAKHEVLHLLLARLQSLAKSRYIQEREITEEIHSLVAKLGRIVK